ncbi:hypothetical protein QVH35_06560 [Candidatus Nitrosotenuis chungbukensis]|uniref:hypothetical protein n=1 Tax=Candidatus Nitrosotenuis chungbukensis TaxID=1353246 RepID=UPI002673F6C1|nr:hypothetical protein [Candidatus Nitrosotenuis chungbukensis]WKT57114.1 hypothetical protein QVH35_06560 [Candidatus Nitrosotenuis chungbukensis]
MIPRKNKITKKNIVLSAVISTSFIMPSFYFVTQSTPSDNFETTINLVYPFLDALVFVPAFISVILFFRGQVNFLWVTVTLKLDLYGCCRHHIFDRKVLRRVFSKQCRKLVFCMEMDISDFWFL